MPRVLVLDAQSRIAVEIVLALARHGLVIDVAGRGEALAFSAKCVSNKFNQPLADDPSGFWEWLSGLDAAWHYDLIIPTTEDCLHLFPNFDGASELWRKCVLPSPASLAIALSKVQTVDLARELGIPVPVSRLLTGPGDKLTAEAVNFPVVLKPEKSRVLKDGVLYELAPVVVEDESERQEHLARILPKSAVLQQGFVEGKGYGIEVLSDRGRLAWSFAHERLHEGAPGGRIGGASTYRRSVTPPADLLRDSEKLLTELNWHGVAMVEFRLAPDGRYRLMEINPRLWGSLALAIDAGVDFPFGLYCLASGRPLPPQPRFRTHYYTRLMPHDLRWIKANWRVNRSWSAFAEFLKLARPFLFRESWDLFDWSDLSFPRRLFQGMISGRINTMKKKWAERGQRGPAEEMHRANLQAIRNAPENVRAVLFLCYGNICRSPVAEALARKNMPEFPVRSAGFFPEGGRRSPENVRLAADRVGVDVRSHRSSRVDRAMVEAANVVVLMDLQNLEAFRREFPDQMKKVLMLGLLAEPPALVIEDPYMKSASVTRAAVAQIDSGIQALSVLLKKGR